MAYFEFWLNNGVMLRKFFRTSLIVVLLLTVVGFLFRLSGTPGIPFPRSMKFSGNVEDFIHCFTTNAGFGAIDPYPSYRVRGVGLSERILVDELMGFIGASSWRGVYVDPTEYGFIVSDMYFENSTGELNLIRKFD